MYVWVKNIFRKKKNENGRSYFFAPFNSGYNDEQVEDYYRQVTEKQPLGGVIEPEQIAEAAWMMTSPALPSLTGQLFIVDGGRSQHPV